jgi:hypothetical protein
MGSNKANPHNPIAAFKTRPSIPKSSVHPGPDWPDPSIPKGLDHPAQGWPDSKRAYPGFKQPSTTTLKELNFSKGQMTFELPSF